MIITMTMKLITYVLKYKYDFNFLQNTKIVFDMFYKSKDKCESANAEPIQIRRV